MRTYDAKLVAEAVAFFLSGERPDFDAIDWVSNHRNIILVNDFGDVAVFEHETPGCVTGHYYFQSRGAQAIRAGKEFLREVFAPEYGVQIIRGLTPIQNLGARWMSRRLGFTSHGVTDTTTGPHIIFTLHRRDYAE